MFSRLKAGIARTRESLVGGLGRLFGLRVRLDAATLDELETILLRADVGVAATARIVERVRKLPNDQSPREAIAAEMAAILAPCAQPFDYAGRGDGPFVLLVVGVNGVGKTTTIAKIAARAALVDGKKVALVTLDNYRVGGIDQIRTFADLIGVPLHVVEDPAQLAEQLAELSAYDLVLIDTAGRSPRDRAGLDSLRAITAIPQIEVHLTIAAGTSAAQIDELHRRFAPLAPRRLLFTKVDEYDSAPELIAAPARLRLPVAWVATGQAVPEDLEVATSSRLLELASRGLGGVQVAA